MRSSLPELSWSSPHGDILSTDEGSRASVPPIQADGIAIAITVSAYHFGPNSGPRVQVATCAGNPKDTSDAAEHDSMDYGRSGASRAVM
jgi:hypothetical protein